MTKRKGIKAAAIVLVAVISVFSFAYVGQASGIKKTTDVWFGLNNLSHNGQDITSQVEPIVVNGSTYLPVRKMAELFNKDVEWIQDTKTVVLTDRDSVVESQLRSQLAIKDMDIQRLQQEVDDLKKQLAEKNSKVADIDDLEDALNDNGDLTDYENVDFEFSLTGDQDDVTVTINVDKDDWDGFTSTEQKEYLQDVCDAILDEDEFKNADITGKVKDGSTTLKSFYTDSDGDVVIGTKSSSGSSSIDTLSELQTQLNDDYDELGDIPVEIRLYKYSSTNRILFKVRFDLSEYEDEWDTLVEDDEDLIEDYMADIYDDIMAELEDGDFEGGDFDEDSTIQGYIYDTDQAEDIADYMEDSDGDLVLDIY